MIEAGDAVRSGDEVLPDSEDWLANLEPILRDNPANAEYFARLFFSFVKALEGGSEGVNRASDALRSGIEVAYLYTEAHEAALQLYMLSLEGHLKPQDEPVRLLKAAIERGSVKG